MKIGPLHDRVIVKRIEQLRKTASGIVIPDSASEKTEQGQVIAVGDGRHLKDGTITPLRLKVGDKVLFGKYAGRTAKIDGEEVLMLREDEVLAVIDLDDDPAIKRAA